MRVSIDAAICQGHGRCYMLAPDIFAPDDDGHGTVIVTDVPAGQESQATLAVTNCPENAITVVQ